MEQSEWCHDVSSLSTGVRCCHIGLKVRPSVEAISRPTELHQLSMGCRCTIFAIRLLKPWVLGVDVTNWRCGAILFHSLHSLHQVADPRVPIAVLRLSSRLSTELLHTHRTVLLLCLGC